MLGVLAVLPSAACADQELLGIRNAPPLMSVSTTTSHQPLKLNFKDDTLTTVSPDTVRALAEKLGLNETQTAL